MTRAERLAKEITSFIPLGDGIKSALVTPKDDMPQMFEAVSVVVLPSGGQRLPNGIAPLSQGHGFTLKNHELKINVPFERALVVYR